MKITSFLSCSLLTFFFSLLSPLVAEPVSEVFENIKTEDYCAFLNAVESSDSHGFYHPEMGSDRIVRALAEDEIHFTYSTLDDCGELPILYINQTDTFCFFNWLHHDCPTGDAVTNEILYTPLALSTDGDNVGFHVATLAPASNEAAPPQPNHQQDQKTHNSSYSSYFYNGLKAVGSATAWTLWNVGGEVVEAIVFQQLGLYALIPYCSYMGGVILYEYEAGEYYAAAGTIVHALFDIACMLGDKIGFDVAEILGSCLEKCGLKCVADFFRAIHEQIDWLLHSLGIEHTHDAVVETEAATEPFRQVIANQLEAAAHPGGGWAHNKASCRSCKQ